MNHSPGMQILHSCMCRQGTLSHTQARKQRPRPDIAQAAWQHSQTPASAISLMACSSHNMPLNRDSPLAACRAMAARTRLLSTLCCLSFMRPVRREEPRTYSRTLAGLSYRHTMGRPVQSRNHDRLSDLTRCQNWVLQLQHFLVSLEALLQQHEMAPQWCGCASMGGLQLPAPHWLTSEADFGH